MFSPYSPVFFASIEKCTCGLHGLNFLLLFFFLFCFFDKVQELEQEKISLEGAMQELGQVSCFLLFVWATHAQVCSP